MIRLILNKIPRPVLQRAAGFALPFARMFHAFGRGRRGGTKGVECPVCGGRYRRFMPYGYVSVRRNALCPKCLSLERHRLLWLWLGVGTDLLDGGKKFLHIAPEVCLMRRFEKIYTGSPQTGASTGSDLCTQGSGVATDERAKGFGAQGDYLTADLESPLAKVRFDVQQIPFPDGSFDVVFCNHVLEHVPDDRAAMREIHRVMRRGGWGVLMVPVDENRERTFEDDTITDPAERTRVFGQYDHRRVYGRDYADRLREAGFGVEEVDHFAALSPGERRKFALRPETIFVVRKV